MRTAFAIARRELRTAFDLPVAYVFMAAFLALGALFGLLGFFERGVADLRDYFAGLRYAFVLFAPAVAMRLWADERRTGTFELLFTLPVRPWEAVLGKFLGAMGLVVASLALGAALPLSLAPWAHFDPGALAAGWLGVLLLASLQVALGLLASSLTENQIVAFVSAAALSLVLLVIGEPAVVTEAERLGLPARWLAKLGTGEHQEALARGVLDARDLVYFVAFTGFFLVANTVAVERRGGRAEKVLSVVLALACAVIAEDVASRRRVRFDLTESRAFSLTEGTKRILDQAEARLTIRCYLSRDLPAAEERFRRSLLDLLSEFESQGGKNVKVEVVDPQGDERLVERAKREGIQRIPRLIRSGDTAEERPIWCGVTLLYAGKPPVALPIVLYRPNLEYDLAVAMKKLVQREPQRLAWVEKSPQRGAPGYEAIKAELARSFTVEPLDLEKERSVPERFHVVVAVMDGATPLLDRQLYQLDQFLMRGGALVVLGEGQHADTMSWRSAPIPVHEELRRTLERWGLRLGDALVAVPSVRAYVLPSPARGNEYVASPYPFFLRITGDTCPDSPVARSLRDSFFPFASEVAPVGSRLGPDVHATRILATRPGWQFGGVLNVDPGTPPEMPPRNAEGRTLEARSIAIAGALAGALPSAFESAVPLSDHQKDATPDPLANRIGKANGARLVVFGDADFARDGYVRQVPQNATLLLDAIDWATQDASLSTLRDRGGPAPLAANASRELVWGVNLVGLPALVVLVGVARFALRRRRAARAARSSRGGAA